MLCNQDHWFDYGQLQHDHKDCDEIKWFQDTPAQIAVNTELCNRSELAGIKT